MEKISLVMFTLAVLTVLIGFGYLAILEVKELIEGRK